MQNICLSQIFAGEIVPEPPGRGRGSYKFAGVLEPGVEPSDEEEHTASGAGERPPQDNTSESKDENMAEETASGGCSTHAGIFHSFTCTIDWEMSDYFLGLQVHHTAEWEVCVTNIYSCAPGAEDIQVGDVIYSIMGLKVYNQSGVHKQLKWLRDRSITPIHVHCIRKPRSMWDLFVKDLIIAGL